MGTLAARGVALLVPAHEDVGDGVAGRPLPDAARAFMEFVHSAQGAAIMTAHAYLPLP